MTYLIIVLLICSFYFGQSISYDTLAVHTDNLQLHLTNVGSLDWRTTGWKGISWLDEDNSGVEFDHGLWFTGIIDDLLIGTTSSYALDFSPGPIINGQAAMIVNPEDSLLYRIYHIDSSSGPGDIDYDEWPIQWGAPHYTNGSPKILGVQTSFSVYNDAHTSQNLLGWPLSNATKLEIHETVWDYGISENLNDVIFFKYQVYNRYETSIEEAVISLWSDIDLIAGMFNWGGYNTDGNYMFMYNWANTIPNLLPRACAYIMLQGPVVPSVGDTATSFGQSLVDYRNLNTTAGWFIFNEALSMPDTLAGYPSTLGQLRNISLGFMMNGQPIIHPLTGDTTTYTYDGDPISGTGWLWNNPTPQGGAGFISSSGTFNLGAGDSTEIIFALVTIQSNSFEEAIGQLDERVSLLKNWWNNPSLGTIGGSNSAHPSQIRLFESYPNPFNKSLTISFRGVWQIDTQVIVYNIDGQRIQSFPIGLATKNGTFRWEPENISSGIYFIFAQNSDGVFQNNKIIYLK